MGALLRLAKPESENGEAVEGVSAQQCAPNESEIPNKLSCLRWAMVTGDLLLGALALCLAWRSPATLGPLEIVLICSAVASGAWLSCLALLHSRQ